MLIERIATIFLEIFQILMKRRTDAKSSIQFSVLVIPRQSHQISTLQKGIKSHNTSYNTSNTVRMQERQITYIYG